MLTLKPLIVAYTDFFTSTQYIIISLYTHTCAFAPKTAVRILSFCLLEPVAMHTFWKELDMFLLLVIDLHSYRL